MKKIMNEKLQISESNPIRARYYDYERFTYPWHFHNQYEIVYVEAGFGLGFVGDCIEKFADYDIFLMGASLPHFLRSDDVFGSGQTDLRVRGVNIQFEENFMQYSFEHYPQFVQVKNLLKESKRGILFPASGNDEVRERMAHYPDLTGVAQIVGLLDLLSVMAASTSKRLLASPYYYEKFPTFGNSRADKILSYINSNYTRALRLEEVAEKAHMNSTAFCRFFKEATGKTFLQYVNDMRIGYACKLLAIDEMEISQVAVECGFDSASYFNRAFKQSLQLTPTQYRNHFKE
ncbi:MAG: AraC family transcriptional regulator [Bacteroides sp.]|nr:AraC family transcriptional regulator [Bacteroides sp.]